MENAKLHGRKWADDSEVYDCHGCQREFTLTVRKHHCRNCGQIFCGDCSNKNASLGSNRKAVRVCEACFKELCSPRWSVNQITQNNCKCTHRQWIIELYFDIPVFFLSHTLLEYFVCLMWFSSFVSQCSLFLVYERSVDITFWKARGRARTN